MYYVYVLKSNLKNHLYVGYTEDLKNRVREHNSGCVKSTKGSNPYTLVYYEAFLSKKDAIKQEKFFKTGYGKEILKNKIADSIDISKNALKN